MSAYMDEEPVMKASNPKIPVINRRVLNNNKTKQPKKEKSTILSSISVRNNHFNSQQSTLRGVGQDPRVVKETQRRSPPGFD